MAAHVTRPFVEGTIDDNAFAQMARDAYKNFDHPDVAPVVPFGKNEFLLELFHGPTLSFKDYALQLVGRWLDYVLTKRNRRATIVVATSGDTGSAAIEACPRPGRARHFRVASQGPASPKCSAGR